MIDILGSVFTMAVINSDEIAAAVRNYTRNAVQQMIHDTAESVSAGVVDGVKSSLSICRDSLVSQVASQMDTVVPGSSSHQQDILELLKKIRIKGLRYDEATGEFVVNIMDFFGQT